MSKSKLIGRRVEKIKNILDTEHNAWTFGDLVADQATQVGRVYEIKSVGDGHVFLKNKENACVGVLPECLRYLNNKPVVLPKK